VFSVDLVLGPACQGNAVLVTGQRLFVLCLFGLRGGRAILPLLLQQRNRMIR
jgi:hypothetical protein